MTKPINFKKYKKAKDTANERSADMVQYLKDKSMEEHEHFDAEEHKKAIEKIFYESELQNDSKDPE